MRPEIYFSTALHCTTCGYRKHTRDDLARWQREALNSPVPTRFEDPPWAREICWGTGGCTQPRRAPYPALPGEPRA